MKEILSVVLILIVLGCSSTKSTSQNVYWNSDDDNAAKNLEQMLIEASKNN